MAKEKTTKKDIEEIEVHPRANVKPLVKKATFKRGSYQKSRGIIYKEFKGFFETKGIELNHDLSKILYSDLKESNLNVNKTNLNAVIRGRFGGLKKKTPKQSLDDKILQKFEEDFDNVVWFGGAEEIINKGLDYLHSLKINHSIFIEDELGYRHEVNNYTDYYDDIHGKLRAFNNVGTSNHFLRSDDSSEAPTLTINEIEVTKQDGKVKFSPLYKISNVNLEYLLTGEAPEMQPNRPEVGEKIRKTPEEMEAEQKAKEPELSADQLLELKKFEIESKQKKDIANFEKAMSDLKELLKADIITFDQYNKRADELLNK